MKKRISLMMALMLVVLSIFSFGLKSNVKATGLTDEDIINIELNNIFVPNEVIFDFPLVTESAYNSSITWNSDNEEIIKIENGWAVVNRPTDSDKEVNLTVTITRGETSNSKTFNITVKQGVTETNTYNISYVLDGGVNNQNNPTTYKVGDTTVLLPATKGTVEFLGWYLDGKKIASLPKGLSGDIELTAKWGAKQAVELVIKNNVNKTEYNALETFDSTGLELTVKYNDGSESVISGNEITFDKTTLQGNDTIVTASYSGLSVEIEIKVNKLNISLEGLEFNGYKGIYDGKEHKVELVGQLPEGIKEVKYTDNVLTNAGTLTAKAEFVYDEVNYNNPGSLTTSIEIEKATLTVTVGNVTIKPGETPTYSYTIEGFVNNETADVLEGKVEYIETATDYNTPGTYPVGAKGLKSANYEINYVQGTLTITEEDYVIEAKDLTKVYNGENQLFTVVIKQGNTEVEGIDYVIKNLDGSEFKGATNVGQYKVVISLVNEEAEDLEVTFEITKANYELTGVEFKDVTTTFDGNVHKLEVTGLPEWLEVSYDKETTLVNAGSITVTASFNHNNPNFNEVSQTLTATLTINKAKLSSVTFEELEDVYYNGEAQEAAIKGKLGNYELTQNDYDIAYEANTQIGTAKVILTGKGNFEGTATLTFEIKESDLSRVRRVKEALEQSYTELPTVFETVKEEANITWMSTSTALMINADGTYKEILTEKAQTVVVYAVVQYNNAVEYAKFEFVLSVKDSDTQIEIEGLNKDITINSTLLTDNQLANYTVEGQSVKYGYDINLLLENQEVQPEGKVTVRIPILEEYKDDETLKVYHVNGTELEDMNAVVENGYLVFETDSFSYYLVTVEAVEGEEPGDEPTTSVYLYEFTEKQFADNETKELNGVNWTVAGDGGYWGYDTQNNPSKGIQLGSSSKPYTQLTLTSAAFNGVTKIVINTAGASKIAATFKVTVGGTQIGSEETLTSASAEYTFTSSAPLNGEIVIEYTQTSAKAIYIKSIEVIYGGQSGTTPEQPEHEHTACPECGKCTAADCNGTDADKCQGHEAEPEHEHTACLECGKCTAVDCDGAEEEKCQGHEQTVIEKITIAEFLLKEVSDTVYYELTGTITDVVNTSYGNFTLVDETGSIYVYGLKESETAGKQTFLNIGVNEGDVVTLIGLRAVYSDSPQVGSAYYVSHTSPEYGVSVEVEGEGEATLSAEKAANGSEVTLTVTPIEGYKLSSIVVNGVSQSLTSGQEYKVKVVGETTVKVKFVEDSNEPSTGEEVTATLTFDNASKRTEFDTSHQVWVENGITLTNNKGKSTSNVADYANPARFYKSSEIIIEVAGSIKEISFTCNSTTYADALASSVGATANGKVVTITLDGTESSYTIASLTGGQVRVDSVTVTYLSESSSN